MTTTRMMSQSPSRLLVSFNSFLHCICSSLVVVVIALHSYRLPILRVGIRCHRASLRSSPANTGHHPPRRVCGAV